MPWENRDDREEREALEEHERIMEEHDERLALRDRRLEYRGLPPAGHALMLDVMAGDEPLVVSSASVREGESWWRALLRRAVRHA